MRAIDFQSDLADAIAIFADLHLDCVTALRALRMLGFEMLHLIRAVLHFLGVPLRIGIELAQAAGYAALIAALRKAAIPRWLCLTLYALMILHPASLLFNNHSMSDSFYTAILDH